MSVQRRTDPRTPTTTRLSRVTGVAARIGDAKTGARLRRTARTDPKARTDLANRRLLTAERKRWALLPATTTAIAESDRWHVTAARHIPGGIEVTVKTRQVGKRRHKETGARLGPEHAYPVETLLKCEPWIRAAYNGDRAHGFEIVPHRGQGAIQVRAYRTDPLTALYGADMIHPALTLPAPHIPRPGELHAPICVGATDTGARIGIPVGPGLATFVWGLTRGGKSTMMRLALLDMLQRERTTVHVCNLEAGANGINDYRHAYGALAGWCDNPAEASTFLWAWIDALQQLPPDLDEHGAPIPKVITRHHIMVVDGLKLLDASGWEAVKWICNVAGKHGGQGVFMGQLANKGDIPPVAQSITRTAATVVMTGRCADKTLYQMAFDTQPSDVDLAHHSGPGRATIQLRGVRYRARLYNEICPTDGTRFPTDVALAHLSTTRQPAINPPVKTWPPPITPPINHLSTTCQLIGEPGAHPGSGPIRNNLTPELSNLFALIVPAPITQAQLVKATGLSRNTVKGRVRALIDAGLVAATTTGNSTTFTTRKATQ